MDVPDRVNIDLLHEELRTSVEEETEVSKQLDKVSTICMQIVDIVENNELLLYKEEAEELKDELASLRDYLKDNIKEN